MLLRYSHFAIYPMGKSVSFCETYQVTQWSHSGTLKSCSHVQTLVKPVTASSQYSNPTKWPLCACSHSKLHTKGQFSSQANNYYNNGKTKWLHALQTRKHTHGAAMRNRTSKKQITSQTHLGMRLALFHMIIHFCMIGSQAFASMIYLKLICTVC